MSASSPALLPCPFCGTADFVKVEDYQGECDHCGYGAWGRRVVCCAAGWYTVEAGKQRGPRRGCGASTGYQDDDAQAIAAWNRRSLASAPRAAEAEQEHRDRWLLWFADGDMKQPVHFSGSGAEEAALATFKDQSRQWTCVLFRSVALSGYGPAQAAAADAPPDLGQRSPLTDGPTPLSVPASVAEPLAALSRAMGTMRDLCMTTVHDEAMDTIESALVEACARPAGKENDK